MTTFYPFSTAASFIGVCGGGFLFIIASISNCISSAYNTRKLVVIITARLRKLAFFVWCLRLRPLQPARIASSDAVLQEGTPSEEEKPRENATHKTFFLSFIGKSGPHHSEEPGTRKNVSKSRAVSLSFCTEYRKTGSPQHPLELRKKLSSVAAPT